MRTTTEIQNDIIRTQGNIKAIESHPFTEEDRAILQPKYQSDLERLQKELKIQNIEVIDPIYVNI